MLHQYMLRQTDNEEQIAGERPQAIPQQHNMQAEFGSEEDFYPGATRSNTEQPNQNQQQRNQNQDKQNMQ